MIPDNARILVVDDDEDVLLAARLLLKQHTRHVTTEKDPGCIPALMKHRPFDVVLLDMNYTLDVSSGREGFHWLQEVIRLDPLCVVILITAYGDVEMAVRAIKEGATDFVLKPWQNEKLVATISAGVSLRRSREEAVNLRTREEQLRGDLDRPFREFVGRSKAMQDVLDTVQKVAQTEANVLILGENGTGKELVARAIHRSSLRSKGPFVPVDLGAISETLFESELFGHVRGAFTDAKEDRAGRFETACGGSLFLDEIGNLSLPLQAKLLAALQNREVFRVGSARAIPVDIRLICATNMPVHAMADEKSFRQDLLYRINTVEIRVPPLRDRKEDIVPLAEHYAALYGRKYQKPVKRMTTSALKKLERHEWPGNVRELQHIMERAVILSEASALQPDDFLLTTSKAAGEGFVVEDYNLEDLEKLLIRKVLEKHSGNISHASKELGLTRASLYRRLEKYGL